MCTVSYKDRVGVKHSTEVWARSLYEAATLGLVILYQTGNCPPGDNTVEVEVVPQQSRAMMVNVERLEKWLGKLCLDRREQKYRSEMARQFSIAALKTKARNA